ncbi:uncharacterized protein LOC114324955 isoform X3 [Diabrotica virgifera virgifera]|uniref:Protein takeout-like n=1 Tax=Diabrotica virgifera virgifera TaxID=50390 RepID=A0ABM5KL32_DIAVI|nr:uncharacterized protein LOC114324955 isoform X3 [Diabrotica virgifera virgifera]
MWSRVDVWKSYIIILLICLTNALLVTSSINICYRYKDKALKDNDDDTTYFFQVPKYDANISHPAIRLDAHFKNLSIWIGHSHNAVFEIPQILNVTFPNITVIGEYNMSGNIGELFDIFGDGDFALSLLNFSVAFSIIEVDVNTTSFCTRVSLDVDVQSVPVEFHGLMGDQELEDLFNKAFVAMFPEVIKDMWRRAQNENEPGIEKFINDIINAFGPFVHGILDDLQKLAKETTPKVNQI